jgi:mono/diheme cytochrome c family protein
MKLLAKILGGLLAVVVLLVAVFVIMVNRNWDRTFDVPEVALAATTDSATIAYGRYLVYGPAHCADCHAAPDRVSEIALGNYPALVGGYALEMPLGNFVAPNITPDEETGIGRLTDGQIARMLRHNVRGNGRAAVPFMAFESMSDEDIVAILSFLRAQEPVRNEVPDHDLSFMGKAVLAFLIKPTAADEAPPTHTPPPGPTVERGAYLANNVANCVGCHTDRDLRSGAFIGPRYAGGMPMEDLYDPSIVYISPNLTPDPETGHIAGWSEDHFVARFRAGRVFEGTHMPWIGFGMMSDDDLRAIYRYLMSLEPVQKDTGPIMLRTGG